jgi:TonB-dependent SusC/RagA subfamily outer membrane receptor
MLCLISVTVFAQADAWQEVRASLGKELMTERTLASSVLSKVVSVELQNVPFVQAVKQVAFQGNLRALFTQNLVPIEKKVTLVMANAPLARVIEEVLRDTDLDYAVTESGMLVLSPKAPQEKPITIRGKVTDSKTGEGLPGANVYIRALGVGAPADLTGAYSFTVPEEKATEARVLLAAKSVGYKEKSVRITLKSGVVTADFALDEDIFQVDEVVITGIASKTSKAVAEVAVARIPVADLVSRISYQGISQLFSGKVSGVNLQIASGNVGSGWRFFVRGGGGLNGDEQPVFYIDGVRVDNSEFALTSVGGQTVSNLSNLNPNDIENIEILKGPAAAAMYGTGGSNGVVLITTKSGKLAQQGKTNVEYTFGFGGNQRYYSYDEGKYLNADGYNKILDQSGMLREHQLSAAGGTGIYRFYASISNRYEEGLIPFQNHMERNAFRANIGAFPSERLTLKVSTGFTWSTMYLPQMDNNIYSWNSNAFVYQNRWNNCDSAAIAAYMSKNDSYQFLGSAQVVWKPIRNFEVNVGSGMEYTTWDGLSLRPYGYKYSGNSTGEKNLSRRFVNQFTHDFNARYSVNAYDVNLTLILGTQILDRHYLYQSSGGMYYPNEDIQNIQSATQQAIATESRSNSRSAGIYWNNEFSYLDTYFWTLAIRRDYASVIGVDAPAITYPKGSLSVRIDKYDILPPDIFGLFKLRVAYGETGQLPGLADAIPLTWNAAVGAVGVGTNISSKGNSTIQPERIKEWEFGIDVEFLKMFSLEFTHYRQNATNSIVASTTAPSTGLYRFPYPVNVGSIKSWGFETQLQINPIRTADYDLNLSLIWNYQKNQVENLGETDEITNGTEVIRPGLPKHEFYTYIAVSPKFDATTKKYIGVNLSTDRVDLGNPVPDHSGSVSVNFRFLKNFTLYAMGEWALNNKIYANSINRLINYNTYLPQRDLAVKLGLLSSSVLLPRDAAITPLTPGSPEYIDAASQYIQYDRGANGNFVQDASFFVFREFSLSYDLTALVNEYLPNTYLTGINVGLSVRNVYRWSKYDLGFEASSTGGRSDFLGEDYNTLPQPRNVRFWAKFGF